jgi:hypothetical protein
VIMDMLFDILLNAGPLGILAIYAIYSQREGQKRLDTLQADFIDKVRELTNKSEAERKELMDKMERREGEIIERWSRVVTKVEAERDEAQKATLQEIAKISTQLELLSGKIQDK